MCGEPSLRHLDQPVTDHPADRDITRTSSLIADLWPLLDQAWTATTDQLTARQQQDDNGGGGGKPGSRPPMRLDMLAHVQTTLDEARTLCCDELGTYLANDRAEEALRRIPGLLEATRGDCATCDRCNHPSKNGDCEVCPPIVDVIYGAAGRTTPERVETPVRHECWCRHRTVARTIGQLHSTLRTALGLQEPRHDLVDGVCPQCQGGRVSTRGQKVWCRDCDFERSGASFGIGVLSAAG
jgi:hypothetical protein